MRHGGNNLLHNGWWFQALSLDLAYFDGHRRRRCGNQIFGIQLQRGWVHAFVPSMGLPTWPRWPNRPCTRNILLNWLRAFCVASPMCFPEEVLDRQRAIGNGVNKALSGKWQHSNGDNWITCLVATSESQ